MKTVNWKDIENKAQWVADLMRADKITADMVTPDLVMAYFDEVGRRIQKMQSTYLTTKGAKEAFQGKVLSLLNPADEGADSSIPLGAQLAVLECRALFAKSTES